MKIHTKIQKIKKKILPNLQPGDVLAVVFALFAYVPVVVGSGQRTTKRGGLQHERRQRKQIRGERWSSFVVFLCFFLVLFLVLNISVFSMHRLVLVICLRRLPRAAQG